MHSGKRPRREPWGARALRGLPEKVDLERRQKDVQRDRGTRFRWPMNSKEECWKQKEKLGQWLQMLLKDRIRMGLEKWYSWALARRKSLVTVTRTNSGLVWYKV